MTFHFPKWVRFGIPVMLGLAFIMSAALYVIRTPGPTAIAPTPTPRPTDLGPNLVTQKLMPSLSYGIQAFLWWNQTTRPRDLEIVRQMRFDTVKQIFNWNDVRADAKVPYDWQHADIANAPANRPGRRACHPRDSAVDHLRYPGFLVVEPDNPPA